MDAKIITLKNDHGEIIYVKRIDKKIYIHHTDCTVDYIDYQTFINEYIVSCEEFIMIAMAIFKLVNQVTNK